MNTIALPVNIKSIHWLNERIDLYYPMIVEMTDIEVQSQMNRTILRKVNELNMQQGYYENPQTTVTAGYQIKTNERSLLSLSLINYAFSGGAHGLTLQKSLTFDTDNAEQYELKDLFKSGSDYEKILSEIIARQIVERNITLLEEFKSIRPDQDYYIADKALVIYFQLYEITAYAYGFPYFPISVYEVQNIIDESGPLGKMLY